MITTVEKVRQFITTDLSDEVLEARLQALEIAIRKHTNNNFQNTRIRFMADIENGVIKQGSLYLKNNDTIQISESNYNNGIYKIVDKTDYQIELDQMLYDEKMVLITKVEYPLDVQFGTIDILRWQLKNENHNYNPDAEKDVQSETISRHSVTYVQDATESDIDSNFGVPRKYTAFLKRYMKARF